jgi:hypothetical protein
MHSNEQENLEIEVRDYEVEVICSHIILVRNASDEEVAKEAGREAAEALGFSNIQVTAMPVLEAEFSTVKQRVETVI